MESEAAYRLLGVEPGADPKLVQRAYRKQALLCHPDRARAEEEKELYTRRFLEIRDAYESLREAGFPGPSTKEIMEEEGLADVDAGWAPAGRSFAPKGRRPEDDISFAEKMGWQLPINLEWILIWLLLLPAGAVSVVLFIRWLLRTLSAGAGP
ncbi:MAG: J domain-containing protein [Elusimicrobiota bacterium]